MHHKPPNKKQKREWVKIKAPAFSIWLSVDGAGVNFKCYKPWVRNAAARQALFIVGAHSSASGNLRASKRERATKLWQNNAFYTHKQGDMTMDIGININSWHLSKIIQWSCFLTAQVPNSRWVNFLKLNMAGFSYQCSQKLAK